MKPCPAPAVRVRDGAAAAADPAEAPPAGGRTDGCIPVVDAEDSSIRISLVIPVYNGAAFLDENLRRAATFLFLFDGPNEIVVVDDASTDGTDRLLERFARRVKGIGFTVLRNEANRGKGYSVRRGMRAARGRCRIFNDADFTYPVEEVGHFALRLEEGADVVIGSRLHPDSRYVIRPDFIPYLYTRHVMSRIFNLMVRFLLGLEIRDTQAGIKGFGRRAAELVFSRQSLNRFSFDLEVLYIARLHGLAVEEVPVRFLYRKEPTTIRFFRDSVRMFLDMWRIRWRHLRGRYR